MLPERPEVRIGDRERQLVIDQLRVHVGHGRLTMDEFEERTGRALEARTSKDLQLLIADLPATSVSKGPPIRVKQPPVLTDWDKAYRIHQALWAVLSVFLVLIWVVAGAGYFWPIWPILGIGLSVGIHGAVKKAVEG